MSLADRLRHRPPGYNLTIGRILAIYAGLMTVLALAALDQTIVATALPRIVGDIGGLSSYSWVVTSYLLASTVTVPLYGKLGDVHGRRTLFLVAITIFLAGSALCGLVWGGRPYGWGSGHVLGALAAAAVLLAAFALVERRVVEPILPFELLRSRNVATGTICVALVGMAMLGTIAFVPPFVQGVI